MSLDINGKKVGYKNLVGDSSLSQGVESKYIDIFMALDKNNNLLFSRDGSYIYFMSSDLSSGSLLLEEKDDSIIYLSNELKNFSDETVLNLILKYLKCNIIVPYIENSSLESIVKSLGGVKIDYQDENFEGSINLGTYMIKINN